MSLIAAQRLDRISRFVDLPQQACSVTCMDALCECHLEHADAWIVVVIVLVMIMTMMIQIKILIIIVTKMTIDCAIPSVT